MAKSKAEVNFMENLKPLLPAGGDASDLEAAAQALAGLSPEDRDLLAAVQESPFRLTPCSSSGSSPPIPSILSWNPVSTIWRRLGGAICLSIRTSCSGMNC